MIVDSTYGLAHGNVRVKRIQEMLEKYIAWNVKWRQEVYYSQVGCSSKTGIQRQRTVPELKSAYVNWKF